MKAEIDNRIIELKELVEKQRLLIIGINNAIENDGFIPSLSQQQKIDYICEHGKNALKEIKKLDVLKSKFIFDYSKKSDLELD